MKIQRVARYQLAVQTKRELIMDLEMGGKHVIELMTMGSVAGVFERVVMQHLQMGRVMCEVYEDVTAAYAPAEPSVIEADEGLHNHVLTAVNLHEARRRAPPPAAPHHPDGQARQHDAALELGRIANTPPEDLLAAGSLAPAPPPPKPKGPDAAAALGLFGGGRARKTSKEAIPIMRTPRNSAADQAAAAAAGAMATEVELEAVAAGGMAAGSGKGWGLGEAPMDSNLQSLAAQEADAFRLIDMVEIFEQADAIAARMNHPDPNPNPNPNPHPNPNPNPQP